MTMTTLDRPDRCPAHQEDAPYRLCRSCAEAARTTDTAPSRPPHPARTPGDPDATRDAIATCSLCDDTGRLPGGHACHHRPDLYDAADRGIAAARAHLTPRTTDTTPDTE